MASSEIIMIQTVNNNAERDTQTTTASRLEETNAVKSGDPCVGTSVSCVQATADQTVFHASNLTTEFMPHHVAQEKDGSAWGVSKNDSANENSLDNGTQLYKASGPGTGEQREKSGQKGFIVPRGSCEVNEGTFLAGATLWGGQKAADGSGQHRTERLNSASTRASFHTVTAASSDGAASPLLDPSRSGEGAWAIEESFVQRTLSRRMSRYSTFCVPSLRVYNRHPTYASLCGTAVGSLGLLPGNEMHFVHPEPMYSSDAVGVNGHIKENQKMSLVYEHQDCKGSWEDKNSFPWASILASSCGRSAPVSTSFGTSFDTLVNAGFFPYCRNDGLVSFNGEKSEKRCGTDCQSKSSLGGLLGYADTHCGSTDTKEGKNVKFFMERNSNAVLLSYKDAALQKENNESGLVYGKPQKHTISDERQCNGTVSGSTHVQGREKLRRKSDFALVIHPQSSFPSYPRTPRYVEQLSQERATHGAQYKHELQVVQESTVDGSIPEKREGSLNSNGPGISKGTKSHGEAEAQNRWKPGCLTVSQPQHGTAPQAISSCRKTGGRSYTHPAASDKHKRHNLGRQHSAGVTSGSSYHHLSTRGFREALVSTVRSLYEDSLRPTLAEVRRRLQELRTPNHFIRELPSHCAALSEELRYNSATQEVFLVRKPESFKGFVDPKSPIDPFECCVWREFEEYMTTLIRDQNQLCKEYEKSGRLPPKSAQKLGISPSASADGLMHYQFQGGRYGMVLKMKKDWRFQMRRLSNMSIGQLCHLVQLSIACGIMQYENNILQPRATCLRIGAAFAQSDLEPERAATNREAMRDEEEVKASLCEILKDEPNGILLSQLKFAFENRLSSRLCQSVFGCTRLSNLLQLPTFQTVCQIVGDTQNRVFVLSKDAQVPRGMHSLQQKDKTSADHNSVSSTVGARDKVLAASKLPLSQCCSIAKLNVTFHHWRLLSNMAGNAGTETSCTTHSGSTSTDVRRNLRHGSSEPVSYQSTTDCGYTTLDTTDLEDVDAPETQFLRRRWSLNEDGALCWFRRKQRVPDESGSLGDTVHANQRKDGYRLTRESTGCSHPYDEWSQAVQIRLASLSDEDLISSKTSEHLSASVFATGRTKNDSTQQTEASFVLDSVLRNLGL